MQHDNILQLADTFHLMGDASRLRIIIACLRTSISVSAIAEQLQLSQPVVSHHLRLLRGARIVKAERRGKQVFYTVTDHHIQDVIEDMLTHINEPVEQDDLVKV